MHTVEPTVRPASPEPWLQALEALRPVPPSHRGTTMTPDAAAKHLGTSVAHVDFLVAAGLPTDEGPDGVLLDYHDVSNVALLVGEGKSLPEQSERRLMRMATGAPADWLAERNWRIKLSTGCTAAQCPGEPPALPVPERLGGQLGTVEWVPGKSREVIVEVRTQGTSDEPRTTAVRNVFDDVLNQLASGRLQFGWLPHTLRADPAAAVRHGVLDCVVAAWLMGETAAAKGLTARTRKGYLLGMVGVEHAWTEVLEDGRWLPLDPVLAHLAIRQPAGNPDFARFCNGSAHNRLLGWAAAADEPLIPHDCAFGGRLLDSCHQLPTARPTTAAPSARANI